MNAKKSAVVAFAVAVVATACGGTSSSSSGGSASSCNDLAASAAQEVDAVIEAHRACTQASDCVGVALSASCFDSCSRSMRADSASALAAAKEKVAKAQCEQFASKGCKVVIPPCAPPDPIACVNGTCN